MHRSALTILQRVLVNHFYKVNAGFFLFFFFVLFGVVKGGQLIDYHLSLIQGMIESFVFLGCVILIWFLYTIKCVNHITKQLTEPRHRFLITLNTLSSKEQYLYMLFVHIQVYMPVLVYALIVAFIAASQHLFGAMWAVLISNLVMILFSAGIYRRYLQRNVNEGFLKKISGKPFFPKPLFSIPLWFIQKERTPMLLITKFFTLLLLYGFINLYEPDTPDIRPILLIMMLVVVAHAAIILQIRFYEEERLVFTKNLPVPIIKKFIGLLLMYLLLLLPELIFIWKGFALHFQLTDLPQILLLTVSMPAFFHSILLMKDIDNESYYRILFVICALLFFVILYNPGIVLPTVILLAAFALYQSHLNDFEKNMNSIAKPQ